MPETFNITRYLRKVGNGPPPSLFITRHRQCVRIYKDSAHVGNGIYQFLYETYKVE